MEQLNEILDVFELFRMQSTAVDEYEKVGKDILRQKLSAFTSLNQPIEFVMLGFPFKSINKRDKVLGELPDLAEEVTIANFNRFNEEVKKVYAPGVLLSMVSDGYVFNTLLGTTDKVVQDYKETLIDMSRNVFIKWYDLNDFYSGITLESKRERLMEQFGVTALKLEEDILFNPDVTFLYRGMIRFMEEEIAMRDFPSRNQLNKTAKALAKEMMFKNEAYSNLVRKEFSSHIRLSMHPSINNGNKYSFQLIPSRKAWTSPWHCAILIDNENDLVTIHKKDAEAAGYHLMSKNGRPYYYSMN